METCGTHPYLNMIWRLNIVFQQPTSLQLYPWEGAQQQENRKERAKWSQVLNKVITAAPSQTVRRHAASHLLPPPPTLELEGSTINQTKHAKKVSLRLAKVFDILAKGTLRQQGCRVAPAQWYWHLPGCCSAPTRDDHFAPARRVALQRLHCPGTCQGGSLHLPMCCIALIVIFPHCYSKCFKMCSIWQCIDICSNTSNVFPSPISQMQRHSDQSCSSTDFMTEDKTWPTQMYSNIPTWKLCWIHVQNAQVCLNMVKCAIHFCYTFLLYISASWCMCSIILH